MSIYNYSIIRNILVIVYKDIIKSYLHFFFNL